MTTSILRPTGRTWWLFFFVLGYNPLPSLIQKILRTLGFGKTANTSHTSFLQLLFASSYAKLNNGSSKMPTSSPLEHVNMLPSMVKETLQM